MLEVGKKYILKVVKKTDFGVYLADKSEENKGNEEERVLLPRKEVPEGTDTGDELDCFIYRDSEDRLIATMKEPIVNTYEMGTLEVMDITRIGAFLDLGLDKEILLPFKEQSREIKVGDKVFVYVYVDKTDRLCATMKTSKYLSSDSPYKKEDKVTGVVINLNPQMGAFIAVDNKYFAMLPLGEIHSSIKAGDIVNARVTSVREDGKLNLSLKEKAYIQMDSDANIVYERIEELGGRLWFDDKAAPEVIEKEFAMSKNAFKRAIGRLLKTGKVVKIDGGINTR